ncbi:MAG: type 2 isopentenyl-diphosphate Delta-isomerase [Candidatus Binatia bacterium]|nr:MAG: type 2 isopentenyl-diphosphate Delta-isomerase [Candidatus Binatia bacterium]
MRKPKTQAPAVNPIEARKRSHLELCATAAVEHPEKTTLLEEVDFVHNALPELSLDQIDLHTEFLGKTLAAPFLITGMTGGAPEAFAINRDLARVAERCGIAFGLGSQRAMERNPELSWTYQVRTFAPNTVVLANIGLTQAAQMPTPALRELVSAVDADGLCIHLNPAQELVQPEGDRDFRNGYTTIRRIAEEIGLPVIVKETGCGISAAVAARLHGLGIQYVDVSGAGGTSWVRVESLRSDHEAAALGTEFASWGIPTAAALLALRSLPVRCIASGGLRNSLDAAKSLALGADLCGMALPVFRAYTQGGLEGAEAFIAQCIRGLKTAMLLTGSASLDALRRQPLVIGPRLQAWLDALTSTERRN